MTRKKKYFIVVFLLCSWYINAQSDVITYRSEFEKIGDEVIDLNVAGEGSVSYSIISGNSSGYYAINASNGKISIAKEIPDQFSVVRTDVLKVLAGSKTINVKIVDGYDYFIQNLGKDYHVLNNDADLYIDPVSEWTVYNNLWGKGTAIPNKDFRISTIHKTSLPDTTYILWDTPGESPGASVWCYVNVFWGNRKNYRENLAGFPFKIVSKSSILLDFDFQQLFGDENFKIAMNMFMTNEPYLVSFSKNAGDFFFVFDQKGTFIPNYPYSLPDSYILGKLFAFRYDDKDDVGDFYERRRVIVKNNDKLLNGQLELKDVFNKFSDAGYLNQQQSIYHIQLGIEVTSGYGAVAFNKFNIQSTPSTTDVVELSEKNVKCYPNPVKDKLTIENGTDEMSIFDISGRKLNFRTISTDEKKREIDFSGMNSGYYIIKTQNSSIKIIKN